MYKSLYLYFNFITKITKQHIPIKQMLVQQQEQEYLNNLLKKHQNKGKKVQNFLKLAQTSYEQKIKAGNYQIKQSSDIPSTKKDKNINKIQVQNMRYMKKNLQKNLKLIDSRIQQLTQPDKRSKSINDEERLKFVSQMSKVRKQLQKKREKQLQSAQKKQKQALEKEKQIQIRKQQQSKKKRKQQIMKRAQSLEVVKKKRLTDLQAQNKQLKLKMQQKNLYQKMIQKYQQKQDLSLQERKKKLAQIRSLYKPLTKSQFQLHLQKIDKLKSQRSRAVDKNQVSKYITNDANNFYKSKWYKKKQQEQKIFIDQKHKEEVQQAKQMKEKLKKYGEYVRQKFKPEVDAAKTKSNSMKQKSSVQNPKTQDLRKIGLKYLQFSKMHTNPNKKSQQNQQQEMQKSKKIPKKINYLDDLKKNSKGSKSPQQIVQKIKNQKNISQAQKAQKILQYANSLERKAKLREQKDKVNHITVDQQLDDIYIQAIAAKLSALGKDQP